MGQTSKVSRLVIISLALWAGSFNCFVCCAISVADECCATETEASGLPRLADEPEACSSEQGCCSTGGDQAGDSLKRNSSNLLGAGRCCMLTGRADAPAVLPQSMIDKASLQTEGEPPSAPNGLRESQFISENSHSRDRGGTYLRCCALLI